MCGHPQFFANTHRACRPVASYATLQVLQSALFAICHDEVPVEQRTLVEDERYDQFFVKE
jgi:hypothetical protein